jgi:hypothetical protein
MWNKDFSGETESFLDYISEKTVIFIQNTTFIAIRQAVFKAEEARKLSKT